MAGKRPLGLFEGIGIELEYMIVDADTLNVAPVCDELLRAEAGEITSDVEFDDISWSNELVCHVIELKTSGPAPTLEGLAGKFEEHLKRIAAHAAPRGVRLMPTAMHPWMDPFAQMKLWPHEANVIYETFDRIFNCRGHGWANLQSMHINLPFKDDEEFGRLHAAIRLVLPILPALAASSPIMDGRATARLDNRLEVYRHNADRIPSVCGRVIPEPVFTRQQYEEQILHRIYRDLEPHDPAGVVRNEFANARGAIARFVRNAIEIRVIDVQECPAADIAVAAATVGVLKLLVNETWGDAKSQQAWPVDPLADIFERAIVEADAMRITNTEYLRAFGFVREESCTAAELWRHLIEHVDKHYPQDVSHVEPALRRLLYEGPAARRILAAAQDPSSPTQLKAAYSRLCECLKSNRMLGDALH